MVARAEDYRWSSYRSKLGLDDYRKVDEDLCYLALAADIPTRQSRYRAMVEDGVNEAEIKLIRETAQMGHPLGSRRFNNEIEYKLGVRLTQRRRGRPRKDNVDEVLA